jgi:hypothetical protein
VICADELGPVIPRTFAPAPGWSADGHRIKTPLEYARATDKTWVYGGLRIRDGHEVILCAPSRNTTGWLRLLQQLAQDNPRGPVRVVADNLSSHTSPPIQTWLARHPRIEQVSSPRRPAGSTCRKAGGDCYAGPHTPARPSPTTRKSPAPPPSPPSNSTPEPNPGSGDDCQSPGTVESPTSS